MPQTIRMEDRILYKYLDAQGGAGMLYNRSLMFTNATQLNDPFDCHQDHVDYSNAPAEVAGPWDQETIERHEVNRTERLRNDTWICSLSKVYNSLLMWTFYAKNHQGVCVGINMDKAKEYLCRLTGTFIGCLQIEVKYKSISEKPNVFKDRIDSFSYKLGTKAKEWEYEQEVRLISVNPNPMFMKLMQKERRTRCCEAICEKICRTIRSIKNAFKKNADKAAPLDWREVHAFVELGGECFDSLYFGANIESYKREKIMEFAKKSNPNIKIYQMDPDSKAFKLISKQLN